MAHKLVSITTALVLAFALTLPGTAGAASSQPTTVSQPSWSWLTQLPWLGGLLAQLLPGDAGQSRSLAAPAVATDTNETTSTQNACQATLFPIISTIGQGSACDPNG